MRCATATARRSWRWWSATRGRSRPRSPRTGSSASRGRSSRCAARGRAARLVGADRAARGVGGGPGAAIRAPRRMWAHAQAHGAAAARRRGRRVPLRHGPRRIPGAVGELQRGDDDDGAGVAGSPAVDVVLHRRYADPDAGAPLMGYIDYQRVPEADFEVGGRRYGVFARDWRRGGAEGWLDLMAARELGATPRSPARRRRRGAVLALSQPEFADAVRRALRELHARARWPRTRCCAPPGSATGRRHPGGAGRADARGGGGGRPASRAASGCARARSHLPAAGRHAGGGRRPARAAVQHLPRPPDARDRARHRLAVAARALRPGAAEPRNSAQTRQRTRLAARHRAPRCCCASPTTGRWRDAADRRARSGDRRQHGRAAGRASAGRRLRAGHRDRARRAARRRRGSPRGSAGRARPHAAAARPGVPGGAAAGRRRRADRGGRADVRGDERDARRARRAPVRARRARGPLADRQPAAAGGPRPPPRARARQRRAARPLRRARARAAATTGSGSPASACSAAPTRARPRRCRRIWWCARPAAARGCPRGSEALGHPAPSSSAWRSTSATPPASCGSRPARSTATGWCSSGPARSCRARCSCSLQEDGRWIATLGGYGPANRPPTDPDGLAGVRRHGRPARGRRGDARRRAAR